MFSPKPADPPPVVEYRPDNADFHKYRQIYSEAGFWEKVTRFGGTAGKQLILTALKLYFSTHAAKTPFWVKGLVVGALGYFIAPLDGVPDFLPGLGFADDMAVLWAVAGAVSAYIPPQAKEQAAEKWREWFGD